jgi:hypothetical protein
MNLRVDLTLPSERRSPSILNLKSLLNIATVVAPIAVLVLISILWVNSRIQSSILSSREDQWAATEPRKKAAIRHSQELGRNMAILKEMEGWQKARLNWEPQLVDVQRQVPPTVQLLSLKVDHNLILENNDTRYPARRFSLALRGKGVGESSERDIETLKNRLLASPLLSPLVDSVDVKEFNYDPTPGAGREDRVFKIDCAYRARRFDETAGKQERAN